MNPYAGNPDSFPGTIPLPDDSDPPAAATFNPVEQGNADRTAALAAGYRSELADTTALKAIDTTTVIDGAIRTVAGLGRFKLDKTTHPTWTEDLPVVVAPTTGTGRWFAQDVEAKAKYVASFNGPGTWMCPPNLSLVEVELTGGGGGGGGGKDADGTGTGHDATGGGGGGAGAHNRTRQSVVGADQYDIVVGDGGVNGTGGAVPTDGGDGGPSTFTHHGVGELARAPGGAGGAKADYNNTSDAVVVPGGRQGQAGVIPQQAAQHVASFWWPVGVNAGDGGYASNLAGTASSRGGRNDFGKAGGIAGTHGTASSSRAGGCGGGGGGAGFADVGGNGGNGGNGDAGSANTGGGTGGSASSNSGAGGGGGGGAGQGGATVHGGDGGSGGSGVVVIRGVL